MNHYLFFKYGRIFYEKIYELWGDEQTAKDFCKALSKQHGRLIVMCEVK